MQHLSIFFFRSTAFSWVLMFFLLIVPFTLVTVEGLCDTFNANQPSQLQRTTD